MWARMYILLDLADTDSTYITRIIRSKPGVASIDLLEGPPDIMLVIEAPGKLNAAECLMDILESIDGMVENVRLLPVQEYVIKKVPRRNGKRDMRLKNKQKMEVPI